jgi:CrcB protein
MNRNYLFVFVGGGLGASFRYWVSGVIPEYLGSQFPYAILTVNVIGCFLIGFLMAVMEERFAVTPELRIFLTIGILGGFTTFSTFSFETVAMLRDGELLKAGLYVALSIFLCLGGSHFGWLLGETI